MLRMALALVVNGYLPGTRVGCHSDNASPGPGGWQHNSQRRQSHVMVATLSSDPRLELPSQLVFSRATPTALEPHRRTTVGAPLNLLNNRGYLLGWRTDSCYQHETVPVGDHAAPELQSARQGEWGLTHPGPSHRGCLQTGVSQTAYSAQNAQLSGIS